MDRLFLYCFTKRPIYDCQLVTLDSQQLALRLSFQSRLFHKKTNKETYQISTLNRRYIEIFIPKIIQEPKERLEQMVSMINVQTNQVKNTIPNFNEIRALFQ